MSAAGAANPITLLRRAALLAGLHREARSAHRLHTLAGRGFPERAAAGNHAAGRALPDGSPDRPAAGPRLFPRDTNAPRPVRQPHVGMGMCRDDGSPPAPQRTATHPGGLRNPDHRLRHRIHEGHDLP
ncbi:hypothetical protein [Arthrobacter sp. U41]|uniref:hypothetical protein n=1 Tax=Arthrobacter sp. U41 TaxID=1849032 RepID=UPI0012F92FED|nr:hypothetical protein [Arthrobacter sp. U41]